MFLAKCGLESRPVVPKHDQSCLLLIAKKRGQPPLEPIKNRQRVAPRSPSPPRHQGSPSASAIATPTGAQFNSAATISPSPSGVPPLGEGGLMKLVERFGVMRLGAESLLPPNVRQLNKKPDDFRLRLNTHLETNDLKKETEEAEGATQMIVVSRPAFDHVAYYARLDQTGLDHAKLTGKLQLYCVTTATLATQIELRGYQRVYVNHIGDDTHLPDKISAVGAGSSSARRSLAPASTRLPTKGLPGDRSPPDESAAQQLVREFELHVEFEGRFFSPVYMWTLGLRKNAGRTFMSNIMTSMSSSYPCHVLTLMSIKLTLMVRITR